MMTDVQKKEQKIRTSEIWHMRLSGATYKEIGKKYKISIPRARQIFIEKDKELNNFLTEAGKAWDKEEMEKRDIARFANFLTYRPMKWE